MSRLVGYCPSRGATVQDSLFLLPPALPRTNQVPAELTVLAIEKFKPGPIRREVPDWKRRGLYLIVQPSGAKSWAFRYRLDDGTPKKLTLGPYPGVDLKTARAKADEAVVKRANGLDPAAEKQAGKARAREAKSA